MARLLSALCFVLLLNTHASAAPIVLEFSGIVGGGSFNPGPGLAGVVSQGDQINGTITLDDETPDSDPRTTRGEYCHQAPEFGMTATLGGATIRTKPGGRFVVQILDNHRLGIAPSGIDRVDFLSRDNGPLLPGSVEPAQFHILLSGRSLSTLDSDALPAFPIDLGAFLPQFSPFAQGQIATSSNQSPGVFINFSVTSLAVRPSAAIPEPSAAIVFGVASILLSRSLRKPAGR